MRTDYDIPGAQLWDDEVKMDCKIDGRMGYLYEEITLVVFALKYTIIAHG